MSKRIFIYVNKHMIRIVKVTMDLYPEDMKWHKEMFAACREVLELSGYEEYAAPILEPIELYEAKSSIEIIERQSYTLTDRSGEKLVLRPEMTPSLARMIAAKQKQLPPLLRWYSFPECWRYERPQKGRMRSFTQLNVDQLGNDSIESDVEILDLAFRLLRKIGFDMGKIEMRINDRKLLDALCDEMKIAPEDRPRFLSQLDGGEQGVDFATIKPNDRVGTILDRLRNLGWKNVSFDPSIVRGFTYYTGIIFEVYDTSGDFRRAIFGGGRYDNLLADVGGEPLSGIGFGVSDVALFAALEEQGRKVILPKKQTVMIAIQDSDDLVSADQLADKLRTKSFVTTIGLPSFDLSAQLKMANRLKVDRVVIFDADLFAGGNVLVKDMQTGNQVEMSIEDL